MRERKREMEKEREIWHVRFGLLTQNTFLLPKKITKAEDRKKGKCHTLLVCCLLFLALSFSFFLFCKRMHPPLPSAQGKGGKDHWREGSKQDGRRLKGERKARGLAGEMRKGRHRREIRGRGREGGRVRRNRSSRRGGRERGRV